MPERACKQICLNTSEQNDKPGMAVVPREAYTTPCSPADCTKPSKSEGRAFAGAAVRAPTETIWGARGSALVVAQSECNKTRAACLLDFEYE